MGTISDYFHLKVNLKKKMDRYDPSVSNKIFKTSLNKIFFQLHELRISPRIVEKNPNGLRGILRGLGETDTKT